MLYSFISTVVLMTKRSIYYNLNPLVCIFTYLKEWKYFYFHVYFLFIAQIQCNNRFSYLYNHSMSCLELKRNISHCVSITAPLILNSMKLKKFNQLDFFVNVHLSYIPSFLYILFFAFCWWEEIQSTSLGFFWMSILSDIPSFIFIFSLSVG